MLLVLLCGTTAVLFPLALAAMNGAVAGVYEGNQQTRSYDLLSAYRDHWPPEIALASVDFSMAILECGYEPEALFPTDQPRLAPDDQWTPYGGYFDLLMARSSDWNRRLDEMRLGVLDSETSAFSSEFLRICIRQSLFASLCAARVRAVLDAQDLDIASNHWPRGRPSPDQSRQTRTICTYLDGIAARRGMPVATPRR